MAGHAARQLGLTWVGFIGSTGLLNPGQCQNDLALTNYNPNNPAPDSKRFVIQAVNDRLCFLYVENFTIQNGQRFWKPCAIMPVGVQVSVSLYGHQFPLLLDTIPALVFRSAHAVAAAAAQNANGIEVFVFSWLDLPILIYDGHYGQTVYYIQHAKRNDGDIWQLPEPEIEGGQGYRGIIWATQVNMWRGKLR